MTEDAQVNPSTDDSKPNSEAEVVAKVFVGNLAFRTRNASLSAYFENIGPVENARVVTQGKRSMGYGFVQFANLEDAKTAVRELHKSRLDEREINVELSTSKNTNNQRSPTRNNKPRRVKKVTQAKSQSEPNNSLAEPKTALKGDQPAPSKPIPRRRKPKPKANANANANPSANANAKPASGKTEAAPKSRAINPRVETEARPVSDTILYVTNIPFALDDEGLKQAFADYNPVSANVIRRKRYNLSKGYGFVTFPDAAQQEAALGKNKSSIGEREVIVRKAHLRPETDSSNDGVEKPKVEPVASPKGE